MKEVIIEAMCATMTAVLIMGTLIMQESSFDSTLLIWQVVSIILSMCIAIAVVDLHVTKRELKQAHAEGSW